MSANRVISGNVMSHTYEGTYQVDSEFEYILPFGGGSFFFSSNGIEENTKRYHADNELRTCQEMYRFFGKLSSVTF